MKIIRARLKSLGRPAEFLSITSRIKSLLDRHKGDNFNFVIDIEGRKFVKEFGPNNIASDLVGQRVSIIDDHYYAQFNSDGTIDVVTGTNESLPRQSTVDQLKRIRKMSKSTDIGDKISDMNKQGANIQYIHNPIDTGIESYEDFNKGNKLTSSNKLKHIKPFKK